MEYLLIAAAAFVGGFLGAMLGRRDTEHPLPVENIFKRVTKAVTRKQNDEPVRDLYAEWLYHRPKGVE